jgi:nitronate monooxygenase
VQNRLTQPLRAAAAKADQPEMISLWAGQAVRMARQGAAESLVRTWWEEAKVAARELSGRTGI